MTPSPMATMSAPASWFLETRPAQPTAGVDFPCTQFRDFYGVLRLACDAARGVAPDEAPAAAQSLSNQLVQLIEMQTLEARRLGGQAGAAMDTQARFLKAALADELLLGAEWAGKPHWRQVLLEARLFHSSCAGEKVFQDIDRILADRDPSQRQPARLYLNVLSLGFLGRYRDDPQADAVARYRRDLYQLIYLRAPDLDGTDRRLSPGAYASTLSHLPPRRVPRVNRWWIRAALALLAMIAISQALWLWYSWPVREVLEGVKTSATGAPVAG